MTPHFYRNLDDGESSIQRCMRLIETHAPRFMKIGGGSISGQDGQIMRKKPRKTTPEERAQILEMARSGKYHQCAIARAVGVSQSSVWHILRRYNLTCPDARKDFGAPLRFQKV